MAIDSTGKIFTMETPNTETLGNLLKQLGGLLGVGPRSDGRYYLADMCAASGMNIMAKYKPFYSSLPNFPSDSERERARRFALYGIWPDMHPHPSNAIIQVYDKWNLDPRMLSGWKRIRDFDGYNHKAVDGFNIKNAEFYNATSEIVLTVNPDTGDNISLFDIVGIIDEEAVEFNSYAWVLVDPFGIIHIKRRFASLDALKSYINSSSHDILYLPDFQYAPSQWWKNTTEAGDRYVPPRNGRKWTIALAGIVTGITPSLSNIFTTMYSLINPLSFTDNRAPIGGIRTTYYINGFTPDMMVGTVYQGATTVSRSMYDGVTISCCSDDYLFLGFTIGHNKSEPVPYNPITGSTLMVIVQVGGTYYTAAVYSFEATASVPVGGVLGTTNGGSGTDWSKGMFFISLTNLFSGLSFTEATVYITVHERLKEMQIVPYISLKLKNTGTTIDSLGTERAVYRRLSTEPAYSQKSQ